MRFILLTCIFLATLSVLTQSQNAPNANQPLSSEQVIRRIVESRSLEGHDQKLIGPMGDAAAVALTRILAGKDLTAADIDGALLVLSSSFSDIHQVPVPSDREPRTAMFVMRYLEYSAKDAEVKKRVSHLSQSIEQQYENYLRESSTK